MESPAKARTLSQDPGQTYTIKASMGHVRDLPTKILGIDVNNGFEPRYVVLPNKKAVVKEIKQAAAHGVGGLPGHRPRPRGRGHLLAPGRTPPTWTTRHRAPRRLSRDHRRSHQGRLPAPPQDRHEAGQRPAGPARPGPPGGLQDQPPALEEGPAGPLGRQGPVGGPPHDRGPRAARSTTSSLRSTGPSRPSWPRASPDAKAPTFKARLAAIKGERRKLRASQRRRSRNE